MRKRNKMMSLRLTEKEYSELKRKVTESGRTTQDFLRAAALNLRLASGDELFQLIKLNTMMMEIDYKLDNIATELNKISYMCDVYQEYPTGLKLLELTKSIQYLREEMNKGWRLANLLRIERRVKMD